MNILSWIVFELLVTVLSFSCAKGQVELKECSGEDCGNSNALFDPLSLFEIVLIILAIIIIINCACRLHQKRNRRQSPYRNSSAINFRVLKKPPRNLSPSKGSSLAVFFQNSGATSVQNGGTSATPGPRVVYTLPVPRNARTPGPRDLENQIGRDPNAIQMGFRIPASTDQLPPPPAYGSLEGIEQYVKSDEVWEAPPPYDPETMNI